MTNCQISSSALKHVSRLLLWVFISKESICRLSKHQKRFQSSEHHLFQVSKSTFYFHTYLFYFPIVWGSVLLRSPSCPHAWDVLLPRISNVLCAVSVITLFKVCLTFLSLSNVGLPLLSSPSLPYAAWSPCMFFSGTLDFSLWSHHPLWTRLFIKPLCLIQNGMALSFPISLLQAAAKAACCIFFF